MEASTAALGNETIVDTLQPPSRPLRRLISKLPRRSTGELKAELRGRCVSIPARAYDPSPCRGDRAITCGALGSDGPSSITSSNVLCFVRKTSRRPTLPQDNAHHLPRGVPLMRKGTERHAVVQGIYHSLTNQAHYARVHTGTKARAHIRTTARLQNCNFENLQICRPAIRAFAHAHNCNRSE